MRLVKGLVKDRQVNGVNGAGFTAGSQVRKEARDGMRGTGYKVSSDKELTEVGRMAEVIEEGQERRLEGSDTRMWYLSCLKNEGLDGR